MTRVDGKCGLHPGRENHCPSGLCGECWLCRESPARHLCPSCRESIEVLPNGRLAAHYPFPGVGKLCPPHDTTERLK